MSEEVTIAPAIFIDSVEDNGAIVTLFDEGDAADTAPGDTAEDITLTSPVAVTTPELPIFPPMSNTPARPRSLADSA
jgi:hypothetical protein